MKVGSRVKVVDSGKAFIIGKDAYNDFGFKCEILPENYKNIEFVVFSKSKQYCGIVYGIIDKKASRFLVSKEGLEKIKKPKKVKEEESIEKPFPKLMKSTHSELIVYFENENDGQVVNNNKHWKNGKMLKGWAKESFQDIDAELIIKYNK